jgi:hypothetical protein
MEKFTVSLEQTQVSLEEMLKYFTNESYDADLVKQINITVMTISKILLQLQRHREKDVEDFNRFIDGKQRRRNMQLNR